MTPSRIGQVIWTTAGRAIWMTDATIWAMTARATASWPVAWTTARGTTTWVTSWTTT